MRSVWVEFVLFALIAILPYPVFGHDIPNARVDRAIQATVEPGRLRIDYEVGLSELTLTQELRTLIGKLPGAGADDWYRAYGDETGILNARGFLIEVDGLPIDLRVNGFGLEVINHPKFTFHFEAKLPKAGRLSIRDTNFQSSEGMSRLAVKGVGTTLSGDGLPQDLAEIPEKPLWQMTDAEEDRSRSVKVDYETNLPHLGTDRSPIRKTTYVNEKSSSSNPLTPLLEPDRTSSLGFLAIVAFGLGAVHALQPGHGKSVIAAASLDRQPKLGQATVVALAATLTHSSSILVVAALLWWSGTSRFAEIHHALFRFAGFAIAAIGLWKLGRVLGGHRLNEAQFASDRSSLGLGFAAGLVPCWDAVALVVLAGALDRLGLGVVLALVFSLGMGVVLVALSLLAGWIRSLIEHRAESRRFAAWGRLASALFLTGLGVYLFGVPA